MPKKILFVTLDSTSLPFIEENLRFLPTLRSALEQGHVARIQSNAPLLCASDYATFASGAMPGEHGRYFPMQWDPALMKFRRITSEWPGFQPFWDGLARDGVRTIVFDAVDVPLAPGAPGIQILNWNTQDSPEPISNRPDLLAELHHRFGQRPIGDEVRITKSPGRLGRMRNELIRSLRKKTDAILWLLLEHDWQFFLTSYCEAHRAGHNLWPIGTDAASDRLESAMLDVYAELDTQLARLLAAVNLSDTAVVLFSLRGMGPCKDQDHFLAPIMDRVNRLYLRATGQTESFLPKPKLIAALRRTTPAPLQLGLRQLVGQSVQDWIVDRTFRGGKHWHVTPAFPLLSGGEGWIRLNLCERERRGSLSTGGQASGYVEFLCRHLRALRVKQTGEPLVRRIIMPQDEFPGPRSYLLPDIALEWQPEHPVAEIWSDELGILRLQSNVGRGGNHSGDGYAILIGATPAADTILPPAHVADYKRFALELVTDKSSN